RAHSDRNRYPWSRVEHDRHRPVVDELDLHRRAEDSALDRYAGRLERVANPRVPRLRDLLAGGAREVRARAPASVGDQCELADDERRAGDVEDAPVERPRFAREDPQARDLRGQPVRVGFTIVRGDADEYDQAGPDAPAEVAG